MSELNEESDHVVRLPLTRPLSYLENFLLGSCHAMTSALNGVSNM